MATSTSSGPLYSFVTEKSSRKKLTLLQTNTNTANTPAPGIKFKILKTSLTANNKFYLDFGEKAPFNFFKCYPVSNNDKLVNEQDDPKKGDLSETFVHPPVWGLCEVIESNVEGAPVGSIYRAMLPMGTQVAFETAHIEPKLDNLVIHRPTTNEAYNAFTPIPKDSPCHPNAKDTSALALVCFPGIITGMGLYFHLHNHKYYGDQTNTIVITSASSKVALALALYLKHNQSGKQVIGYTSKGNRDFCQSTKQYDTLLEYNDPLPDSIQHAVMIDISGKGTVFDNNKNQIAKLLVVGNSSDSPDKETPFANFSFLAMIKMVLSMSMVVPSWILNKLNTKQEIYLIMTTAAALLKEWGKKKYLATIEEYTQIFCNAAINDWGIRVRDCDTEAQIEAAFGDIVQGTVPPNECIVLNVAKAVEHRTNN